MIDYEPFVARLRAATEPGRSRQADDASLLDGAASFALRSMVTIQQRRRVGAFFTPSALAEKCLIRLKAMPTPISDPACGAGDLLIAAARRMRIGKTAAETLRLWGPSIHGSDIVPEFVAAAKLRLTLLAMARTQDEIDYKLANRLLSNIKVGSAIRSLTPGSTYGLLLLNPPFGDTKKFRRDFHGSGRVARASIFADRAIKALVPGAWIVAILPDVLRSGSTYGRWRAMVSEQLRNVHISVEGRFDSTTDVDVFTLVGQRRASLRSASQPIDWYQLQSRKPANSTVDDAFDLHVGQIVEYRDKSTGADRAFLKARDLTPGKVLSRLPGRWPAGARAVIPPFVAICRTSSPDDTNRIVASVISGKRSVAVENHVITARPRSNRLEDAVSLMNWLISPEVSEHLGQRIRCRHLTLSSLGGLPWPESD
jgi:hypothetical protein